MHPAWPGQHSRHAGAPQRLIDRPEFVVVAGRTGHHELRPATTLSHTVRERIEPGQHGRRIKPRPAIDNHNGRSRLNYGWLNYGWLDYGWP